MTRIIVLALFIFETSGCLSQVMKIENRNRRMRAGFRNDIGFSFDRKFDSLELRSSKGAVERDRKVIYLFPGTPGKDTLFARFFKKGKFLHADTSVYNIVQPEVFATYASELLKKVSKPYVKACGGIGFHINVTDYHWEGVLIKSYRFSVIRKDSIVFSIIEYSYQYSDALKAKLEILEPGDKILISDIIVAPPYATIANCLPSVFEIE